MGTLLYRSPNVIADAHEWHIAVRLQRYGKVILGYYWRPLGTGTRGGWKPAAKWQGPKPKRFSNLFARYRPHAVVARDTEHRRQEASRRVKSIPPTAATLANAA